MTSQVQTNSVPRAVSCRSEHTVRDVVASGIAGYLGTIGAIVILILNNTKNLSVTITSTLISGAAAVGTTAWILSRMNQRQAKNAPSLDSRNIKPLVSTPKVLPNTLRKIYMTSQVQKNSVPQAVSCRSEQHTVRDVVAGALAVVVGCTVALGLVALDMASHEVNGQIQGTVIESIFGNGSASVIFPPLIGISAAVGTTAWILSRMNQRQAKNVPSLESRNIKPLVSSPKVSSSK